MPLNPIWENFSSDIFGYATSAFSSVEPYLYPFVIIGIIGFIYAAMNSIIVAVVAVLITFAAFATTTSIFEQVPQISQFFYIISIIGITLLVVTLFLKRRH